MSESNEICDNRKHDSSYFDLVVVYECFKNSLVNNDDVLLGPYLDAYKELSKFCSLIGSVFRFVKDDIDDKAEILATFRQSDENGNFDSLRSMVKHEMDSNLLQKNEYTSGCRTLLRLHRGLDFLRMFLKRVSEATSSDSTASIGKHVYNDTLAKFHPLIIRTVARVAMHALPARDSLFTKKGKFGMSTKKKWPSAQLPYTQFIGGQGVNKRFHKVCGDRLHSSMEALPRMLEVTDEVYRRTDKCYQEFNLHELP